MKIEYPTALTPEEQNEINEARYAIFKFLKDRFGDETLTSVEEVRDALQQWFTEMQPLNEADANAEIDKEGKLVITVKIPRIVEIKTRVYFNG